MVSAGENGAFPRNSGAFMPRVSAFDLAGHAIRLERLAKRARGTGIGSDRLKAIDGANIGLPLHHAMTHSGEHVCLPKQR